MLKYKININQIKGLSCRYTAGELDGCIQDALQGGSNACLDIQDQTEGISMLSMAGFVRSQMEQEGLSVSRALRILGQRMRRLAAGSPGPEGNDCN